MLACVGKRRRLPAACCRLAALLADESFSAPQAQQWSAWDRYDRTAEASPSQLTCHGASLASSSVFGRMFSSSNFTRQPATGPAGGSKEAVHPLWNWPNAISGARLLSGPGIAYLIVAGEWPSAFVALGLAGASDWLDGFLARRFSQGSVVGSYLDPLADKVLICCTAGALAWEGSLPLPLAGLIIGRDVLLVGGAFGLRLRALGWRWPGWREFFRTVPPPAASALDAAGPSETRAAGPESQAQAQIPAAEGGESRGAEAGSAEPSGQRRGGKGAREHAQPAPFVQPLYISKVNTVAQLSLVAACIASARCGWPPEPALLGLGGLTGGLTLASGAAYWRQHRRGSSQGPSRQEQT